MLWPPRQGGASARVQASSFWHFSNGKFSMKAAISTQQRHIRAPERRYWRGARQRSCVESELKSPFTGEATRTDHGLAARRRKPIENTKPARGHRLILSATGMAALAGLGALAILFTAPFADPPATAGDIRAAAVPSAFAADGAAPQIVPASAAASMAQRNARPGPNATAPSQVAQSGPVAPSPNVDALEANDPRWAKVATLEQTAAPGIEADGATTPSATPIASANTELASAEPASAANVTPAAAAEDDSDPATAVTALQAIQTEPVAPLTPEMTDDTRTAAISPEEPAAEAKPQPRRAATGAAATGAAPTSNGVVTTHVKLRARATNGAAVVAVIPDNASVGVVACDLWCEVVYKGRRGFIYKDFVGKPRAAQPQIAAEQDKPKIVKPARIDPSSTGR